MTDLLAQFAGWLHDVFVKQLDFWVILGFVAQFLFTMRFVVQWIASERAKDFRPVDRGFTMADAVAEANRCLDCKKPQCVQGCPVNIDIPHFIEKIRQGNVKVVKPTYQSLQIGEVELTPKLEKPRKP